MGGNWKRKELGHKDVIWEQTWKSIASMEGLHQLRVELDIQRDWCDLWAMREMELLEPLKMITRPAVFELVLPFRSVFDESVYKELPCKILRRLEDTELLLLKATNENNLLNNP